MDRSVLMTARKVVSIGNSLGITLPSEWIDANRLKVGDTLIIKAEAVKRGK